MPLLDLRYLRPFNPAQGFAVHVDGLRRLPNEKNPAPLLVKCDLVTITRRIGEQLQIQLDGKRAKGGRGGGHSSDADVLTFSTLFVVRLSIASCQFDWSCGIPTEGMGRCSGEQAEDEVGSYRTGLD